MGQENLEQIKCELLLAQWIFDGLLPYAAIQSAQFKTFIEALNKKFYLPSEKILRTKIMPDVYARVESKVQQVLNENKKATFSVTTPNLDISQMTPWGAASL